MGGKPRKQPTLTEEVVKELLDESKENVAAMGTRVRNVFRPTVDRLLLN